MPSSADCAKTPPNRPHSEKIIMAPILPRAMDEPIDQQGIARARALLATARAVVVLTGAGVSAESGIPTFRDALTGVWSRFRPEDLATREAFLRDPARVWAWYAERRATVARA